MAKDITVFRNMDGPIDRKFLEEIGFHQLEGAPNGVLTDGKLQYHPEFTDKFTPGRWSLQNPASGVSVIPDELQPVIKRQVLLLTIYRDCLLPEEQR